MSLEPLISQLSEISGGDIVVDDRTELTIGKRLIEAKQIGYPYVVIIGKAVLETIPKIELYDTRHERSELVHPNDLPLIVKQKLNLT